MKCKKCRQLEDEELVVHLWETHGRRPSDTLQFLGYQDEDRLRELIQKHRNTGKEGRGLFRVQP